MSSFSETSTPLPLVGRGKVREIYDAGDDRLLMITTDRISAFDVVLPQPIPRKGEVLTQVTTWWLGQLEDITPHHLITADPAEIERLVPAAAPLLEGRRYSAMLVKRTEPVMVECVVRGYLSGSAWAEYREHGTLAGEPLPPGLVENAKLDPPIFSPATKAVEGHDENITFDEVVRLVGSELAEELRRRSLAIYERGRKVAERRGIIVADTKFEFGLLPDGTLILIDEVLTPDSSRFWPSEGYEPGRKQPSFDKQPVRDYLEELSARGLWDKTPPAPDLPHEVVEATSARYRDAFYRLTGRTLEEWESELSGSRSGG